MRTILKVLGILLCVSAIVFFSVKHQAPTVASAAPTPVVQPRAPRAWDSPADKYQFGLFVLWAQRLDQVEIKSVKALPDHYICAEVYEPRLSKKNLRFVLSPRKTVPTPAGDKFWNEMECNSEKAVEMYPQD